MFSLVKCGLQELSIKLLILTNVIFLSVESSGQSLPVGATGLEDYYRRAQLLDKVDSNLSFTIRPISLFLLNGTKATGFYPDTTEKDYDLLDLKIKRVTSKNDKATGILLPVSLLTQFNTNHPYGWNDGPMIPAKGFQTVISAGVYAEYGPLSIQLKPELAIAANDGFTGLPKEHYEVIWARYYDYYNYIDLPQRFGNRQYSKAYWGQSSIRLNFDPISFGLSTENLWWGPGIRSSLLMSNTAPGFKHLTLNTTRPIKTAIGSFEGQLIAGKLEGSGFGPLEPDRLYFNSPLYLPKPEDWRYISGLTISWQPKYVPGLFLGMSRSFQMYSRDLGKRIGNYLPVFLPFHKINGDDPLSKRDQMSSFFMRWLWKEEKAELYFEYGRNDHSQSLRDFTLEPEDSRAYIVGLRKIVPFNKQRDENLLIGIEVTQLQETSIKNVFEAESWYVNKYIRHGYTNRGEMLGAGIGPGGNLQSLDISWFRGLKRIGLQIERYVHNNDFYYYAYHDSNDWRRHWVDLSIGASGEWSYKNLIFNTRIQGIKSYNYQWLIYPNSAPVYIDEKPLDVFNLQVQMGVTYRF